MKNFEEKLEKLEYLTNNIKRPDISLEEALKNFEEGIKLAKTLEKQIDEIEGKIQILANNPSLENNEEPEKLSESMDVSDTWAADGCSQEEFDELYQKAKEIMSKAVRKIGGEIQLTITEEEEERMVDAILEEVIFSPSTDFFY